MAEYSPDYVDNVITTAESDSMYLDKIALSSESLITDNNTIMTDGSTITENFEFMKQLDLAIDFKTVQDMMTLMNRLRLFITLHH